MIRFIENIGDYYSQHFFDDGFPKRVFDKAGYVTQKKDSDNKDVLNHLTEINALVTPLREKYFRFKNDLLNIQRPKDKVKRTHDFHTEVLKVLGYPTELAGYQALVHLDDDKVIPVRYKFNKGNKPYLFIMEMKAIVREGDNQPEGIYEQTWMKEDWEKVYPPDWKEMALKPDVIKDALSEMFLLPEEDRPVYVIMMAGAKIFLIHYEKWKYDSYLLFDLEELFTETQLAVNKDYLSLFYALLASENFLGNTDSLLNSLDEDAHKAAYGVTQNLKKAVIYAVENLANEAIWYKLKQAKTIEEKDTIEKLMASEAFARELKDECLSMVYRLLFLFYAEAREDLEILPVKDPVYQKGYSLEMLRDLEFVHLGTSSKDGYFFCISLWKLFDYLHKGVKTANGFEMKPLDSPLFDNAELKHLTGVQFRNIILQQIIKRLSLSEQSRNSRRGRISYSNLGINQLGSVYESLLAYSGFFAAEKLIEVKAADDPEGKEGTYLVPLSRRDDFKEEEILKNPENPALDKEIPKGYFVYRLNGRDRKKSASYYTPEVLTQTTVKYTLKGILDKLKERQEKGEDCADEILGLKILEPAMGAAAFHNEVINQLADAYLELKEAEEVKRGRKRIVPGEYNDELQKVKAYIATNNVYGVDLNPTAVELGKLSLWLNCMHRNMETPFFAHRLGVGNAVVGCWLKVYDEKDVVVEYPTNGTTKQRSTPIAKAWWTKAPERVAWNSKGILSRKSNQFYHFLLPDENMLASAGIGLIKEELTDAQKKAIADWKKEIKQPLTKAECARLEKLCKVIDTLLEEHYKQIKGIIKDTTSVYAVYGQQAPQIAIRGYNEKERLAESRNVRSAPYYKLRMVMDYWCSLWFWDARKIVDLPSRTEWYNEVEKLLGIDLTRLGENASANEIIDNLKKHAGDTSTLYANKSRLGTVEVLRNQHRFFHNELEFVEVFKENGGFDVIVGNPPWIKLQFEEKDIVCELYPEAEIRDFAAPEISTLRNEFFQDMKLKEFYLSEFIGNESTSSFLNSFQNYPLLDGQQTNLYKCVIENGFQLVSEKGYFGILHPEGVYDDPNGAPLRKEIYHRLLFRFHFRNELKLFPEVGNRKKYCSQVYGRRRSEINFFNISTLFHPKTIESCFSDEYAGENDGEKLQKGGSFIWNTKGNRKRIINYTYDKLLVSAKAINNTTDIYSSKLTNLFVDPLIGVFDKFSRVKGAVNSVKHKSSVCWDETGAVKARIIKRETKFPAPNSYELILNGPHFYVATPFYQTPRSICNTHKAYETIDLLRIDEDFLPRTNFVPVLNSEKFGSLVKFGDKHWLDLYKLCFSRRLNLEGERTLQPSIFFPGVSHVHPVISVVFDNELHLLKFAALCSSILYDFYVKSLGGSDFTSGVVASTPFPYDKDMPSNLFSRCLLLNCLNSRYSDFWEKYWDENFLRDKWSKNDDRLKPFDELSCKWNWKIPLRNSFERRQALIEIDVLTAMTLGFTLEELILVYRMQFPVLQQNENETWYDRTGQIIFTSSMSFPGVGLDRAEWDKITKDISPMQKTLKDGTEYKHTITKSELYKGQQITYYPPFEKCDRVEDYKIAWAHFEWVFATEKVGEVATLQASI